MTDTLECGCRIVRKLALQEIEYCPMHQAAKQMLEALKLMVTVGDAYINIARNEGQSVDNAAAVVHRALAAIKATGG